MLSKALVVLAINALLADTLCFFLPATDHHEMYHVTKWRSHGWVKMANAPTLVSYLLRLHEIVYLIQLLTNMAPLLRRNISTNTTTVYETITLRS